MKFGALAFSILFLSFNTQAASIERAEKLVKSINAEKTVAQMIVIMSESAKRGFVDTCVSRNEISKENCELLSVEFGKGLKDVMSKAFETKSFLRDMAEIYASEFTDDELDQLNNFYTSPAGKAYIEKLPVIIQKSSLLGQKRAEKMMPELENLMNETIFEGLKKKQSETPKQ